MSTTAAASRSSRPLRAFGSLAGNRALLRVLAAYLMFTLTEYAVWIAMLVFAYGRFLGRYGRGEGVGEIALLRAVPRTATVTAHTAATVYRLDRDLFLTAVLGHARTRRQADRIAAERLATR